MVGRHDSQMRLKRSTFTFSSKLAACLMLLNRRAEVDIVLRAVNTGTQTWACNCKADCVQAVFKLPTEKGECAWMMLGLNCWCITYMLSVVSFGTDAHLHLLCLSYSQACVSGMVRIKALILFV